LAYAPASLWRDFGLDMHHMNPNAKLLHQCLQNIAN